MTTPTYEGIEAVNERNYLDMNNLGRSALYGKVFEPLVDGPQYRKVHKLAMNELANFGDKSPIDWTTVGDLDDLDTPNTLRTSVYQAVIAVVFPGFRPMLPKVAATVKFVVAQVLNAVAVQVAAGNMGATAAAQAASIDLLNDQANAA